VKLFGVSNWNAFQLDTISKYIDIRFNQIELSLTQSSAIENGTLDKMKELEIKLMIWSPLGDFYQRKQNDKLVIAVDQLAKKYKVATSAVLINWLLQLPLDVYLVFGSTNIDRIKKMQQAYSFDLSKEEWFYLWQMARGKEVD
jgi:predicted oxidoreductase